MTDSCAHILPQMPPAAADRDLTENELLHLFMAGVDDDEKMFAKMAIFCHFLADYTPYKTVMLVARDHRNTIGMGNISGLGDIPHQIKMLEDFLMNIKAAKLPVVN